MLEGSVIGVSNFFENSIRSDWAAKCTLEKLRLRLQPQEHLPLGGHPGPSPRELGSIIHEQLALG